MSTRLLSASAAVLAADHKRDVDEATGHVVHARRLIEDLVGADQKEVHIHEFDDRAQAVQRGIDAGGGSGDLHAGRAVAGAAAHVVAADAAIQRVVARIADQGVGEGVAKYVQVCRTRDHAASCRGPGGASSGRRR